MFELREGLCIQEEMIEGSRAFVIDNFYKNPDEVVEYLLHHWPRRWRDGGPGSLNGKLFDDRRHIFHTPEIIPAMKYLSELCGQEPKNVDMVKTNLTRWFRREENDYKNKYWWPHKDDGYNGVLYLNKDDEECGTNLYRVENEYTKTNAGFNNVNKYPNPFGEHMMPWRKKKNYSIIKSFKPKYNRLVLFDGYNILHAMNICNDRYFNDEYRLNQVFFFLNS